MDELKTDVDTTLRSSIEERLKKEPESVATFSWKDPFKADTFDTLWFYILTYGKASAKKSATLIAVKSKILAGAIVAVGAIISWIAKRYKVEQKEL